MTVEETLRRILSERIVVMDGAMGTALQAYGLDEAGYRGQRFKDHDAPLQGCSAILSISPESDRAWYTVIISSPVVCW